MLSKKQVLQLQTRREVYNFVVKHPGLHKRKIIIKLKLSEGTIKYHINYLRKHGFISEKIESGYTRYYVTEKVGRLEKEMLGILRQDIPRKIILYTLHYFVFSKAELCRELEKDEKTIYYHLKKLKEMDIIEPAVVENGRIDTDRKGCIFLRTPRKKEILFQLKDPFLMYHLLFKYKDNFFDDGTTKLLMECLEYVAIDSDGKTYDTKGIDRVINTFNEFFPLPFCA